MKTFKLMSRLWIWTLLIVLPGVATGLQLLNILGPSVVVNGTTPLLVLDCEYELSERDKYGLVVKWYFNRNPFPTYQWTPNSLPQDLGILKGRIDLNYQVSNDPFMKHRALAIRNPTVDLSGEYTCWISSFQSEAMARKNVTIYSPASELTLTWTKPTDVSVLVLCKAIGVYPEPHIAIFRIDDTTNRNIIDGADVQISQDEAGYSVSVQLELFDYELEKKTVFKCELNIPGTEYQRQEQILYYPAPDYDYENDDGLPHHLEEHQYFYDQQKRRFPSTTTTASTTVSSTSTTPVFVATMDDNDNDNDNENEVNDYYIGNDLPEHPSINIVNKENDLNIDSVSKAQSVIAEETPRVAESVSGGKNNSWNSMLLWSLLLLQNVLQFCNLHNV